MPKQIIGETFEQLGQTVKHVGKQVVKLPAELAETVAEQAGVKPEPSQEQAPEQAFTPAQIAQRRQKARRTLTALEAEIQDIRRQKAAELPKQVTGKPGFSEEKAIRQLEVQKEKKKELPPVVLVAKRKASPEIRIKGPSG